MREKTLRRMKCDTCRKIEVVEVRPNEHYFNRQTVCSKCSMENQRKIRNNDYPKGYVNFLAFIFFPFGFYMYSFYKGRNKPSCAKSVLWSSLIPFIIFLVFLFLVFGSTTVIDYLLK